jgi:hypothetical protein
MQAHLEEFLGIRECLFLLSKLKYQINSNDWMRKILRLGARRVRLLSLRCLFLYQVVYSLWLFAWRQECSRLTAGADVYIRTQLIRGQMSAQIQLTFSLIARLLALQAMSPPRLQWSRFLARLSQSRRGVRLLLSQNLASD